MTLAQAPASLQAAVRKALGRQGLGESVRSGLRAVYGKSSVELRGAVDGAQLGSAELHSAQLDRAAGWSASIGLGSIGRAGDRRPIVAERHTQGSETSYRGALVTERFSPRPDGIEQSFLVRSRPAGTGPLQLSLPLRGVAVKGSGDELGVFADRSLVARYGGLRVIDGHGRALSSAMRAVDGGAAIEITVDDAGADYPLRIDPTWSEAAAHPSSLMPSPQTDAFFGYSTAISGANAIVGAYGETVGGDGDAGEAYVFNDSSGTWSEVATLEAPSPQAGAFFGSSVSISGANAIVGAYGETVGGDGDAGEAYVFNDSSGTWSDVATLDAPSTQADAHFGISVAISGLNAIVGAVNETVGGDRYAGVAYVFNDSSGTWSDVATLDAPSTQADAHFGISVAISGANAVVGAYGETVGGDGYAGEAYVFNNATGTTWTDVATLDAPSTPAAAFFGNSVAISGANAIVGAFSETVGGDSDAGEAYVFNNATGTTWTDVATLEAPSPQANAGFGYVVAISGANAVVGAPDEVVDSDSDAGEAYVFDNPSGTTWTEVATLDAPSAQADAYFGRSVAISGANALVGAPDETVGGDSNAGEAWLYAGSTTPSTPSSPSKPSSPATTTTTVPVLRPRRPVVTVATTSELSVSAGKPKTVTVKISCTGAPCAGRISLSVARRTKHGFVHPAFADARYSLEAGAVEHLALGVTRDGPKILPRSKHRRRWRMTATVTLDGEPTVHHLVYVSWPGKA